MAKFNPDIPRSNDPSYLGYSRESSGDDSSAALIKGLAGTALSGVKYADEVITENAKTDVSESVAAELNSMLPGAPGTAEDQGQAEGASNVEEVDVFGEEKTQATVPEINRGRANAERLTKAYKQGRLTPTYYWGRMAAKAKELKARYPGYTDVIDKQFQGLTGQIPANALANAKRKEVTDHLAKVNLEEKAFQGLVKQKWVQGHLPADYWERVKSGDPYTKLEVYEFIQRGEAREADQAQVKTALSIRKDAGDVVKDEAIGAASDRVNTIATATLSNSFNQKLVDSITESITQAGKGKLPTPEEKQALRAQFGLLKAQIRQKQIAAMNAADPSGKTYNSLIDDPAKIKAILENGLAEVNVLEDLLENEDYGLFSMTLNNIKAREEDTKNTVLSKAPIYGYIGAIKSTGGAELAADVILRTETQAVIGRANQSMVQSIAAATIAGENKEPLSMSMQSVNRSAKGSKEQRAGTQRSLLENNIKIMTSPKTTETAMANAAEVMFGEGNRNFLLHFAGQPQQQRTVYDKMVSPHVTEAMKKLRTTQPKLWDRYKDWAKESFVALQATAISTVQEGFEERPDVSLTWDPQANQFIPKLSARGQRRATGQGTLIETFEAQLDTNVTEAVNNLNRQIKLLENILKVDGTDVTQEISVLLGAAGINPKAEKTPTVFSKAREAVNKVITEEEQKKTPKE